METQITFTFGQLLACVGTVCGTITGIAAAVAVLEGPEIIGGEDMRE